MTILQSILLGLLQGIAEFLPISSSGHLKIAQALFKLQEIPVLFDVMLHLATLLAVCIFFREKIFQLFCSFISLFRADRNSDAEKTELRKNDRNYILSIVVATIITAAMGIVTKKLLDEDRVPVKMICAGLIVTAVVLLISSLIEKKNSAEKTLAADDPVPAEKKSPSLIQAVVIGFAQGIGTLPGISRSGSTIAGALFCGVNRQCAGEFSFIVSIPAILGAFILELKDLKKVTETVGTASLAAGCIVAFVSGYLALKILMGLIKKGRLHWFAAYLIPVGIIGFICF